MKKKKHTKQKGKQGNAIAANEKAADDGWERLMKIREKLGKADASDDKVTECLAKIGEEIAKGWTSEKSGVEILSEMRR